MNYPVRNWLSIVGNKQQNKEIRVVRVGFTEKVACPETFPDNPEYELSILQHPL